VDELFRRTEAQPGYRLTIDLEKQEVTDDSGWRSSFAMDPFRKDYLLRGLDDIGLTLQHEAAISEFEKKQPREIRFFESVDLSFPRE